MVRIPTSELPLHAGQLVELVGWLHRLRRLRNVAFVILRDQTGLVQIVVEDEATISMLAELHMETSLAVTGMVATVEQAPRGIEIHQPQIEVVSAALVPPVFDLFRPTIKAQLPTILDNAPLALRHPRTGAVWRIAAAAMAGFRKTLDQARFIEIQSPKIVSSATESGANVFQVDYFGTTAFLAQSPQFYKQMMVSVYERVYEVGPVFRAEPHATTRHLAQYTSLDVEMGFINDHHTVIAMLTQVLAGMIEYIRDCRQDEIALLGLQLPEVPEVIPTLHFREAQEMYYRATGEDLRAEPDLSPAQERWLGQWACDEHQSAFMFITGYPMAKRPFYTYADPHQPGYSNSFDLLFNGLELVTGGQRLHNYEDYLAALEDRGLDSQPFQDYLAVFKYGMPPHGGFAIGLERFIAQLVGAQNIREVALFPRDMSRLTP